jgi:hypothetical protein
MTSTEAVVTPPAFNDLLDLVQLVDQVVPFPETKTVLMHTVRGKRLRRTEKFERRRGTFIVPFLGAFSYFSLNGKTRSLVGDDFEVPTGGIWRMSTPLKDALSRLGKEGMLVDKRHRVFWVTLMDISRGVVRDSNFLDVRKTQVDYQDFVNGTISARNSGASTSAPARDSNIGAQLAGLSADQPGTGQGIESIDAAADLAFREQISTLLSI